MRSAKEFPAQAKLRVERARADHAAVDVAVRTFRRFSEDDGGFSAAALTYYFFFSIFPLLLFAAALLGYLTFLNADLRDRLFEAGLGAAPLLGELLTEDALAAIQERRGSLAAIGAVLALYSGSGAVVALEHALNRIYRVEHEPPFLAKRIRSLKWLAAAGAAVVVTVAVSSTATFFVRAADLGAAGAVLGVAIGYAVGLGVNLVVFLAAFRILPGLDLTWVEVFPGALFAAVAFELLKVAGTWYLARGEAARTATFGAFAAAAALLVASYLLAQVVLVAAELNAVLRERRELRSRPVDSQHERQGGTEMQEPTREAETAYSGDGYGDDKSAGQLMKEVTQDLSTLFRKEIELAKQEISSSVAEKAKGAAIIAVAATVGLFALIFLLLAIRDGLDNMLWTWVADIVTGLILLAVGAGAALFARRKLSTPIQTELTKKTIKEDVEFAKTVGRR